MSVVTALMIYFCAFVRSEIFPKNTRELGVGHGQFLSGISGLIKQHGKEKLVGIVQ